MAAQEQRVSAGRGSWGIQRKILGMLNTVPQACAHRIGRNNTLVEARGSDGANKQLVTYSERVRGPHGTPFTGEPQEEVQMRPR